MEVSGAERIQRYLKDGKQVLLVSDIHTDFRDKTKRKPLYLPEFIEQLISLDSKITWDVYLEQGIAATAGKPDLPFLELLYNYFLQDEFDKPEKQESHYYKKFLKNGGTLLALTKSYFGSKGCFLERSRCHIPNARFHFIDIRQRNIRDCYLGNAIPFTRFYNELFIYLYRVRNNWNKQSIGQVIDDFKNDLLGAIEDLLDCKRAPKILKQAAKSIYKRELLLFFQPYYKKSLDILTDVYNVWGENGDKIVELMVTDILKYKSFDINKIKLVKTIEFLTSEYKKRGTMKLIDEVENNYPDNINAGKSSPPLVSIAFVIYTSMLMNMYTIGRITKSYNKNVVVIAGINHINYAKDFYEKMGWEKDIESKKLANKRVLIPNILISGSDADTESVSRTRGTIFKKKHRYRKTKLRNSSSSSTKKRRHTKSV